MQTLVEVGRQEYEYVENYFTQISTATAKAARSDSEKVGAQGIEFWTSLAEEEYERKRKNGFVKDYIAKCGTELVNLLIECI